MRIFTVYYKYHLPGDVISAAVGLVYTNVQPEYELARLVSDDSEGMDKFKLGALSLPATRYENLLHGV